MNNPKLIPAPFAINGQKNSIPDRFSSEMPSNTATWDQGFPPITTLPATAGGLPPIGQDFNGIFNQVSENIVFLSEGGRYKFSEEHAVSIGGYKQGAILQSDDENSNFQSLVDGNTINFNTAPAADVQATWKEIPLLQIAKPDDVFTGADNTKAITPAGLQGKGMFYSRTEYITNSSLNASHFGARIWVNENSPSTLTLPSTLSLSGSGQTITIWNVKTTDLTVKVSDISEYIAIPLGRPAEITLKSTESVTLTVETAGAWQASGDAMLKYSPLFSSTTDFFGYQRFPSKTIIQWVNGTMIGGQSNTINFPIAFPSGLLADALMSGYAGVTITSVGTPTRTSRTYYCTGTGTISYTGILIGV